MPEASDTAELLIADLERLAELDSGVCTIPVGTYDRVVALLKRPLVKWVREYYETEQGRLPVVIRDSVRASLAALSQDQLAVILTVHNLEGSTLDIETLRFETSCDYDDGCFFSDRPTLVATDGVELDWEDVFGDDAEDLNDFTGDLSDVFGPLSSDSVLEINMETGVAMEPANQ